MIDYLFRMPKFPLICNIDGLLIAANSAAMFQRRIDKVTLLPDKRYNAVDATGARWIYYPDKMYVAPSLERKWSKKKIIRMYNESKNCQSTG
jgi:hypothetical protein